MEQENQSYELTVSDLGSEGEGVAKRKDGKTVFVKWALKGETVRVLTIKSLSAFDIARLLEVVTASPDRVLPPCPIFRRCGGCQLQHMDYAAQLNFKKSVVQNALYKYAGIAADVSDTVPSPKALRYRNKLSVPVRAGRDGNAEIGFFEANSHRVVPLIDCLLQPEWNAALLAGLRRFLDENAVRPYDERTGDGIFRHLTCRESAGHLTVTAVVARREPLLAQFFTQLSAAFPSVTLYENINRAPNNVILGDTWRLIGEKKAHISAEVPHPAAFCQVNDDIAESLYRAAAGHFTGGTVIDAFSGGGRLTHRLSRTAKTVYGIELSAAAHADALSVQQRERADNMHPLHGDCAVVLPALLDKLSGEPVSVLLDPPRKGCAPAILSALIAHQNVRKIVYISCNPATLARDVKALSAAFTPVSVQPYDMFPQTAGVETLCVLEAMKSE